MLMILHTTTNDRIAVNPFEVAHVTIDGDTSRPCVRIQMRSGVVFHVRESLDKLVGDINSATERFHNA